MSAELPPFRCPKCDVIMLIMPIETKDGKLIVTYECDPCGTHEVKAVPDTARKK